MGAERKIWDAIAMDVAEVEAKEAAISAAEEGFSMVPSSPLTLDNSLPLPLLKPHITYYSPSPLISLSCLWEFRVSFSITGLVGRFQIFESRFTENCAGICSRNGGSMTILVSRSRRCLVASRIFVSIFCFLCHRWSIFSLLMSWLNWAGCRIYYILGFVGSSLVDCLWFFMWWS